jgi:hypothetical protein
MKTLTTFVLVAFVSMPVQASAASGAVGDSAVVASSMSAARDLYTSAAYDDALAMLNGLAGSVKSGDERQSIDLYRTLCLVALGRSSDAQGAIESMIARDPLYHPQSDELSPKLLGVFTETRRRMLPSIIQKQYADAKVAFDKQDWPAATAGFNAVLKGMAEPDIASIAGAPPLSDLRTLSAGFRDLAVKSTPPPAPPPAPKPTHPVKAFYGAEDAFVTPPAAIQQKVPRYPNNVLKETTGILEFTIDETGAVQAPSVRMSIDSSYDQLLISAAKKFQYQPATVDGMPVKYLKRLTITVSPAPQR